MFGGAAAAELATALVGLPFREGKGVLARKSGNHRPMEVHEGDTYL